MTNSLSAAPSSIFFFFNDTATTEIYTLSLHDALPICPDRPAQQVDRLGELLLEGSDEAHLSAAQIQIRQAGDRKSTRLNSSHSQISYAVFCLKKKKISVDARNRRPTTLATLSVHLEDS